MTVDEAQLDRIRQTLAADDYHLEVRMHGDRAEVLISAGPDACDDCLAPKPLMRSMLAPVLGLESGTVELRYPTDPAGP